MAEKLNIPTEVIDSEWKDDVDVDYAIYGGSNRGEMEYVSPQNVSKETMKKLEKIKSQNIKFGIMARFAKDKLAA